MNDKKIFLIKASEETISNRNMNFIELTPELEEKIIKRLEDEEDNKTLTVGTLQTIRKVFQKLKELVENV